MATGDQRITVDGTSHPIHDDAAGVRVYLRDGDGNDAEVQVAFNRGSLVIAIAGDAERTLRKDQRGYMHVIVYPTAKVPA